MANIKTEYAASSALTMTSLNTLASSSGFTAGAESTAVDNTSNKYLDFLLAGNIITGTTPVVSTNILVYVIGMLEDSTWPDVFDGTDSAETITSSGVRDGFAKLAASIVVSATSNVTYPFGPVSVAQLFGGRLPKKFVVFVTHNGTAALNASAGTLWITPVYATVA